MDLPDLQINNEWIEIPKEFCSDLTSAPMERCISCDKYLLEQGTQYLIEKAFKRYQDTEIVNTIFEYAICYPCAQEMQSAMSADSMQKIGEYFAKNTVDLSVRRERILDDLVREREMKEHSDRFQGYLLQHKLGYITDEQLNDWILGKRELGVVIRDPRNDIPYKRF